MDLDSSFTSAIQDIFSPVYAGIFSWILTLSACIRRIITIWFNSEYFVGYFRDFTIFILKFPIFSGI
jgi:hypothetical protein